MGEWIRVHFYYQFIIKATFEKKVGVGRESVVRECEWVQHAPTHPKSPNPRGKES